ncbi:zf-DHHC-domain-containing protein [Piedraia hortae CBS 480.64]|uniref:Palmitoyltransferase n=1 Tax=Piedraia hortae CBS 480.64 TaxID=1314780 RepID=A0A6A7C6R5_9PEZI|nr:zf-DHHC-domain-containing protein [Piedraia hortae CBS 480.64]
MPLTSFNELPTHALGASTSDRRRFRVRWVERKCCHFLAHFPLLIVHGLTAWAIWVHLNIVFLMESSPWHITEAVVGFALYLLSNVSYAVAVFTSPGSPLDPRCDWSKTSRGGYEGLPTHQDDDDDDGYKTDGMTTVTAKNSSGRPRYCNKCQTVKPDRAHHCSSCGRCVLKMDHHCPWLATCVGLRNYKPFLLFLIYVSCFCWVCLISSGSWIWGEVGEEVPAEQGINAVNAVMLAVLALVIGIALTGFTIWHIYLALTNQTTIESLEKTRYLAPFHESSLPHQDSDDVPLAQRVKEIHANVIPGVTRPEEGEASSPSRSPAADSLQRSYASMEARRDRERYRSYQDELDSEALPNAFDLGWKRNLLSIFGAKPLFWGLPVCNTPGDGWSWPVNPSWIELRAELARTRAQREREENFWSWADSDSLRSFAGPRSLRWTPGRGFVDVAAASAKPPKMQARIEPHPMGPKREGAASKSNKRIQEENWNDIPDNMLVPPVRASSARSPSPTRWKGD